MTLFERLWARIRFKFVAPLRLNRFSSYYLSCSQFGEDMIVRHLLGDTKKGFYVDIGAHHPVYYSNTYHFYCRGWQGINVDAVPGSMELFRVLRPRDINIEASIDSVADQVRELILFDNPALNTLSPEEATLSIEAGVGRIVGRHTVRTRTLTDILEDCLPKGQMIDFLSIDIEGLDEVILRTHDFTRYRPRVIVFERKNLDPMNSTTDPLVALVSAAGYQLVAVTGASLVMLENSLRTSPKV